MPAACRARCCAASPAPQHTMPSAPATVRAPVPMVCAPHRSSDIVLTAGGGVPNMLQLLDISSPARRG